MRKALFVHTNGSDYYTFLQYVSNGTTIERAMEIPYFEHICCYIGESEEDNDIYTIIANGDKIAADGDVGVDGSSATDYKIIN